MTVEKYRDFRQSLRDLVDERVRICFSVVDTEHVYRYYGWIREVDDHTLDFEADRSIGEIPVTRSCLNLEAIVIYCVDVIDPEADISVVKEGKYEDVETVVEVKLDDDPEKVKQWTDKGYVVENLFTGKAQLVKRRVEAEGDA